MSARNYYEAYWSGETVGRCAEAPPAWSAENLKWHEQFFRQYTRGSMLDVGAGEGTVLGHFQRVGMLELAVGVELSLTALARGRQQNPDCRFVCGTFESLPFGDESYDTVFAVEVLEHLLDVDNALSEVRRVLKPGGHFCVTTTDFNWPKKLVVAAMFWEKYFYPNNPHVRFFTGTTLRMICAAHGLRLVARRWNGSYWGLMPKGQMAVFVKE